MPRKTRKPRKTTPSGSAGAADRFIGYSDGACAGNPGPMGIGGVLQRNGITIAHFSENIGPGTNNEAEYLAAYRCLSLAAEHGVRGLLLRLDSQLVAYQLCGRYEVRNERMRILYNQCRRLIATFPQGVVIEWIRREKNGEADALASQAVGMPQAVVNHATGTVQEWAGRPVDTAPAVAPTVVAFVRKADFGFAAYTKLRVGGRDTWSVADFPALHQGVHDRFGASGLAWLLTALGDKESEPFGRSALRWCARGLAPDKALKKAAVEQELSANIGKGKPSRPQRGYSDTSEPSLF